MSTKTSKVYTIMKDGIKIKTTKSLNTAKAIAAQEQADVFCGDECVYKSNGDGTSKPYNLQTTEAPEAVKAVENVHAVQTSETQSDVGDNGIKANPAANSAPAAESVSNMAGAKTDMADADIPTVTPAVTKPTAVADEPRLGISIHNAPQPKYENYRLTALMNVRAAPSLNAPVLRTALAGTVVQVSQIENNGESSNNMWMKIRNGSDFAYILYEKDEKDGKNFAEKVGA